MQSRLKLFLLAPIVLCGSALVFGVGASASAASPSTSLTSEVLSKLTHASNSSTKVKFQSLVIPYRGVRAHAAASTQLPLWIHNVDYPPGNTFTYAMVGADPSSAQGNTTVTVSVPVIPVRLVFSDSSVTDASLPASDCGRSTSPVQDVLNSPLFQNSVSGTQLLDAFQRANFNTQIVGAANPNYHVLLSAVAEPMATLDVPAQQGSTSTVSCGTNPNAPLGFVSLTWFDSQLQQVMASINTISPSVFPVFVLYDTVLQIGSGAAVAGGYHAVVTPTLQTYAVADYQLADLVGAENPPTDIYTLAHEMAEWMDNPLEVNFVPTWGYVGQDLNPDGTGRCQDNLEVADPLDGKPAQPVTVGSSTYHVPDLAFASWFFRQTPSTGLNGTYSLFGTLTGASSATVCPAQPVSVKAMPGHGEASVTWTEPSATSPIDSFVVLYQAETDQAPLQSTTFDASAQGGTLPGLTNGTTYDVVVVARSRNAGGHGECPTELDLGGSGYDCSTFSNDLTVTPMAKPETTTTTAATTTGPGGAQAVTASAATANTATPGPSAHAGNGSPQLAFTGAGRGIFLFGGVGVLFAVMGGGARRRLLRYVRR